MNNEASIPGKSRETIHGFRPMTTEKSLATKDYHSFPSLLFRDFLGQCDGFIANKSHIECLLVSQRTLLLSDI